MKLTIYIQVSFEYLYVLAPEVVLGMIFPYRLMRCHSILEYGDYEISDFSKTQLVVYYQCYILIG